MKLIQQPEEGKLLISKQLISKYTQHFLFLAKCFIFWQTRVFRITCYLLFKSSLVANSLIAKPEECCFVKIMYTSIFHLKVPNLYNNNSQPISSEYNVRHLKYFLQLAAKVAANVLFQIRFFRIQLQNSSCSKDCLQLIAEILCV